MWEERKILFTGMELGIRVAGIAEFTAKRRASKGIGVRVLASLAGHKSIATTQAYIDVNDEMKRAAVELAA
jgi:integrase